MNRKLLLALKARHEKKLKELRTLVESGEVREADLSQVTEDIEGIIEELEGINTELAATDEGEGDGEGTGEGENRDGGEGTDEGETGEGDDGDGGSGENRAGMITQQQRDGLLGHIKKGMEARNRVGVAERTKQMRSKFAQFVVGKVSESEARAIGIVQGNGNVIVPKEIVPEIISYAQEINPLRTDGTMHRTGTQLGFPVLVKKATVYGHKKERATDKPITQSEIAFDEITLDPTEFDALALITKKLIKRSDINIEDTVIEELGKAYAEKEGIYFFRGDDPENINNGSLSKKSVQIYATKTIDENGTPKVVAIDGSDGPELHDALVDLKNSVKSTVRKRSKWYLNDAAQSLVEKMKDKEGRPLYDMLNQVKDGIDGRLLNYPVTVTEFADVSDSDSETPVFYFGDPKTFHMQEVENALETQTLVEKYADTNHVGVKIYNMIDGQLIYSPLEPTYYKLVIGKLSNG